MWRIRRRIPGPVDREGAEPVAGDLAGAALWQFAPEAIRPKCLLTT